MLTKKPYLANAIAYYDHMAESYREEGKPLSQNLIFSSDHLIGERDCIVVDRDALIYAAEASIEDTQLFADALTNYAIEGADIFFEMAYVDFASAFPFSPADDIDRIGILIITSPDGYRFQTITLLDDGVVRYEPYYMFLPLNAISEARNEAGSDDFSHTIFNGMELEFSREIPAQGSAMEKAIADAHPISATIATIGISLLALKAEYENNSDTELPVLQSGENIPRILALSLE